jgi:hypothetical protein
MARLQILELPEGVDDARAPFVLVVDQCVPQRVVLGPKQGGAVDHWQLLADRIGARGVIVTPETLEIPANEVSIGPDGYPVRLRVEADLDGFRAQIAEMVCQLSGALADLQADNREAAVNGGHRFGGPGYEDPPRCRQCGLSSYSWHFDKDRRLCAEVRGEMGGQ